MDSLSSLWTAGIGEAFYGTCTAWERGMAGYFRTFLRIRARERGRHPTHPHRKLPDMNHSPLTRSVSHCIGATIFLLGAASTAKADWIREPLRCNDLSSNLANSCKETVVSKGKFEYHEVKDVAECRRLHDTSLVWVCADRIATGKSFNISMEDRAYVQAKVEVEEAVEPSRAAAKSLETMAFYMKVQTIILVTGVALGVLVGIIAAVN